MAEIKTIDQVAKQKLGFKLYKFLDPDLQDLLHSGLRLIAFSNSAIFNTNKYKDYSFSLLPVLKVYEGYLQKLTIKVGLKDATYYRDNPETSAAGFFSGHKKSAMYKYILDKAADSDICTSVFSVWDSIRNKRLHYHEKNLIQAKQASQEADQIIDVMRKSYSAFVENPDVNLMELLRLAKK